MRSRFVRRTCRQPRLSLPAREEAGRPPPCEPKDRNCGTAWGMPIGESASRRLHVDSREVTSGGGERARRAYWRGGAHGWRRAVRAPTLHDGRRGGAARERHHDGCEHPDEKHRREVGGRARDEEPQGGTRGGAAPVAPRAHQERADRLGAGPLRSQRRVAHARDCRHKSHRLFRCRIRRLQDGSRAPHPRGAAHRCLCGQRLCRMETAPYRQSSRNTSPLCHT